MEDFRPYKGVIVTSHHPVMFKTGNQMLTNGGALYTIRNAIYKQIETVIVLKKKRAAQILCLLSVQSLGR